MPLRLALPPSLLPEHENDDKIQERRSQFSCPLSPLLPQSTTCKTSKSWEAVVGEGGREGGVANNGWRESPLITS